MSGKTLPRPESWANRLSDTQKLRVLRELAAEVRPRSDIQADVLLWAAEQLTEPPRCVGCGETEKLCDCHQFDPERK